MRWSSTHIPINCASVSEKGAQNCFHFDYNNKHRRVTTIKFISHNFCFAFVHNVKVNKFQSNLHTIGMQYNANCTHKDDVRWELHISIIMGLSCLLTGWFALISHRLSRYDFRQCLVLLGLICIIMLCERNDYCCMCVCVCLCVYSIVQLYVYNEQGT